MIRKKAAHFCDISSVDDLGRLIRLEPYQLQLNGLKPTYKVYTIPKKDGSKRLIEDPGRSLKTILRKLNHYLQAVYHGIRPQPSYGFSITARGEADRNIITNARQHMGQPYMLNMDLENFFHTISKRRVRSIWQQQFQKHDDELLDLCTQLCTWKGRLPMGAPTSPVLSNFACLPLDAALANYCQGAGIQYTRFADDLCFSSAAAITSFDEKIIRDTIQKIGFLINEKKITLYGEEDKKMVTGLVVGTDNIELQEGYLEQVEVELGRLQATMLVEQRYQTGMSHKKLKLLKQELQGKINFATMVLGDENDRVMELTNLYHDAVNPPHTLSARWLDIPYNFE